MAFVKKRNKLFKYGITLAICAVGCLTLGFAGYFAYTGFTNGVKQGYEEKVRELELQRNNDRRRVFVAKEKITFGARLDKELFNESEIISNLDPEMFMGEVDFGKYAKSEMPENVPVMKYMVSEEQLQDDVREQEFNMFLLQSNLEKDKFIDLRIMFPNGEDFIVLSKKKIRSIDISKNTIWCWLNERETVTVSSAIVDAYINQGTKLYVVTYVEPTSQAEATPTYPANIHVMSLMETNPNILDQAKLYLAEEVRKALDKRLENINPKAAVSNYSVPGAYSVPVPNISNTDKHEDRELLEDVSTISEQQMTPQEQEQGVDDLSEADFGGGKDG
ncbi:hypothetical protein DFR58_11961 [Anaerobacterium chartisolvens]|uniref:SAF domain-containing protein n=1 Tax=Anaerobacterium chartisolvens TaxID=1297424 RepID=A0A369AZY2_9FIRM|nr:hypothetical protein [Anaerobacterium chartisolvens]RCX13004.1 hypothetical protein DFR58_11961 [Anaerobacterium chartisolvens]